VIDLYSRRVVGWSMQSRQTTDAVLQALHMAVLSRTPHPPLIARLKTLSPIDDDLWPILDLYPDLQDPARDRKNPIWPSKNRHAQKRNFGH